MAKIKHWDGTKWLTFDAKDSDTVDGKHAADFAPIAHVGAGGTAHSLVTTTVHGFMSATDKAKLDTVQQGAQVNQKAIRHITINTIQLTSNVEEGEVKFVSGTNIALTPDATTNTVTVGVTGTVNNADKVDGFHAASAVTANAIPVRDAAGKVPGDITGSANLLDGYDSTYFATASHTHSLVTTTTHGFMSATDKSKLNGIAPGAEVNQNAFSSVVVKDLAGTVKGTFDANSKTDNYTFVQGVNVTLTPDTIAGTIQIDIHDPMPHNHDDRYYTETEVNNLLAGKSDTTHNHDAAYVNATGDTMTGALTMGGNNLNFAAGSAIGAISGGLSFSAQSDSYRLYVENYTDVNSRMIFHSSDDGSADYFLFRHKYYGDTGSKDLFAIQYTEVNSLVPLKQNGQQVWHAGNLAKSEFAAASHNHDGSHITTGTVNYYRLPVGTGSTQVAQGSHNHDTVYVKQTGGTINGTLTLSHTNSQLIFNETDTGKRWHTEVNGNNFSIVESGIAIRGTFTTGGDLLVSGNEAIVKNRNYIYSTSTPSGTAYSNGDIWIQY